MHIFVDCSSGAPRSSGARRDAQATSCSTRSRSQVQEDRASTLLGNAYRAPLRYVPKTVPATEVRPQRTILACVHTTTETDQAPNIPCGMLSHHPVSWKTGAHNAYTWRRGKTRTPTLVDLAKNECVQTTYVGVFLPTSPHASAHLAIDFFLAQSQFDIIIMFR